MTKLEVLAEYAQAELHCKRFEEEVMEMRAQMVGVEESYRYACTVSPPTAVHKAALELVRSLMAEKEAVLVEVLRGRDQMRASAELAFGGTIEFVPVKVKEGSTLQETIQEYMREHGGEGEGEKDEKSVSPLN